MPNLNEYYQLLQKEEPPLSNNALREMLASAMERADKEALDEALAAPQATASVRRSRLHGTGIVASTAAIITLTFWGFTYFQSQQSSAPRVQQETVQSEKNEVGTLGNTTTTEENTSRSTDTQYNAQQTDQFLQSPFAAISHTTRPQTNSGVTTTVADTIAKNNTTQMEPSPADSLLPEDFRSWEMPSYLAWAVAERRYNDALGILDSLLLRKHALPNTKFNLLCLRGHLHKIMGSVNASIADYSSALDMHESSELYLLRAIQYRTASQHQEALQDFTNAIRLNPYNTQAIFMRGTVAHKLGRLQEACSDWLAAAEMGNTSADSMVKVKCNPTVVQNIRTAQTKRLEAIKTLALLIERTKESIDKTPSPNSSTQSLTIESLIRKIFSSSCDISTVLKGEASAYCAFQALHTIAVELRDDSLALLVKPALEKKTTYSNSAAAQRTESNSTIPIGVTEIVSVLDQKVLATMNGGTLRTSGIDPVLTNSRSNITRSRNSNRMGGNNSVTQYQTLPPEILRNVLQTIEDYCRTTYPEIAAQAPSSVKAETTVQTLSPPAQQDTARTSQTSMRTTQSRTNEATVLAPIVTHTNINNNLQSTNNSIRLGIQYFIADKYEEAYQSFDHAVHLNPNDAQAVFMRGNSAHKLGRFDEACADWLAAAELGNTLADSILKAKCNPAVVQTIRTAQTKRLQAIKTLALLIERTKESIDKVPSSNLPLPSLKNVVEALVKKIFSSGCDLQTVLKGEASTHCAFQAIHTIALELQDDSLAAMVNPVIQKKNNYSSSPTSQWNNTPTNTQTDAISPSYFDMEVLTSMAKNNPRLQQRTHDYVMKTTPRYSSQMRENNSAAQNQTLPPEILHNVIQAIEKYCRATYPEIAAQAPSSVKAETTVQTLSPPAQQDTARTSQTSMSTTDSRTAMAEAEKNVANTVLLLNTLQNKLQSTRNPFPQTPMPQLDSLSYRTFGNICNTNNVTDSTISASCMVHLLYSFALELHDPVAINFARKIWKRMNAVAFPISTIKNRPNTYNRTDNTNYNEIITREVANGGSADRISSLQSRQAMQSAIRATQEMEQMDYPSDVSSADIQGIVQLLQQMKQYYRATYPEMAAQAPSSMKKETKVDALPTSVQQTTARTLQTSMNTTDSRTDEASVLTPIVSDTKKTLQSTNSSIELGTQYFTTNKYEEAYQSFDHAVRLDPQDAQAVFMRGAAAYNLKRFEEACDDWYLAAQMGHPFADSVLEQRCASFMPKYVRTAQAEHLQKIKTLALLLDRVKQGIDYFPTSFMRGDQLHSFDSLSYKSLSPSCSISAILIGNASTYCALHTIYTLALEFNDVSLALLIKSLGLKPRNSPNLLSKNQVVNNLRADDAYSQYQIIESQKSLPKSSTAPSPNTNVGFQRIPTGNGIADKLGRTQEQRLLQREMQLAFQQIEEYCRAKYPQILEK